MKNSYRLLPILFTAILFMCIGPGMARAQGEMDYAFVVIETTVTRKGVETSDKNPDERRFYISNIVEISQSDKSAYRNANKTADEYFIKSVVKPMEAKGILHQYYDENVVINNNGSYTSETRQRADETLKETLAGLKEQNANIFTFTWNYGKIPDGLVSSQPTLLVHKAGQPLYEPKATAPIKPMPKKNDR